jgi:hypothetical protein
MTEKHPEPGLFDSMDEPEEDRGHTSPDDASPEQLELRKEDPGEAVTENVASEPESIENQEEGRVYVLCSNWSIAPLFSRGCLLAPTWGENTDVSFLDQEWEKALPHHIEQLPANWVSRVREDRRNSFPIAARTRSGMKREFDYLPLSEVDALIFATHEERNRLVNTAFDDFSIHELGVDIEVDPFIFSGPDVEIHRLDLSNETEVHSGKLRRADCRAGLRVALPHIMPGKKSWISALGELWGRTSTTGSGATAWIRAIDRGLTENAMDHPKLNLEESLLTAISRVLAEKYPVETGWPGTDILTAITEEVQKDHSWSQETLEILDKWADHCRNVIAATEDLPPLDDSKGIPFRAGMYLLLRSGDLNLIRDEAESAQAVHVGNEVRALAGCLASIRTGMRNLSSDVKQAARVPNGRIWTQLIGDTLLSDLGLESSATVSEVQPLRIELESDVPLTGEWNLFWNEEQLFSIDVDSDPILRHVSTCSAEMGWLVQDLEELGISVTVSSSGSPIEVRVSRHASEALTRSGITLSAKVTDLPKQFLRPWRERLSINYLLEITTDEAISDFLKSSWRTLKKKLPWPGGTREKNLKEKLTLALAQNEDPGRQWTSAIRKEDGALVLNGNVRVSNEDEPQAILSELERIGLAASDLAREIQ